MQVHPYLLGLGFSPWNTCWWGLSVSAQEKYRDKRVQQEQQQQHLQCFLKCDGRRKPGSFTRGKSTVRLGFSQRCSTHRLLLRNGDVQEKRKGLAGQTCWWWARVWPKSTSRYAPIIAPNLRFQLQISFVLESAASKARASRWRGTILP